ncbi:MAG: GNAT family N-acetyltransferase [Christensenellales bacterium]|jgi:predicted acetyltransferase
MSEYETTEKDAKRIREIWEACFDDTKAFGDWFFTHRYTPAQTLAFRENGEILSNLQMIPYRVRLRGRELASWFIVGAATLPEARNRGHMAALLKASFARMREAGVTLSHLYPFQYDFYRRFGYEVCSERLLARLSPSDILGSRVMREAAGWPVHVTEIEAQADLDALKGCYDAFAGELDGWVVRDGRSFELRLMEHALENGGGLAVRRNGEIRAYALYALQEKKVVCPETVYVHPLDLYALIWHLARRFSQMETIEFATPVSDTLRYRLKDGRARFFIEPFDMMRIVDLKALLEALCFPQGVKGAWVVEIRDPHAPWNDGRFLVRVDEGRASVESTDSPACFTLSIDAMAQIVCGLVPPLSMARCRRLRYGEYSRLLQFEEAFPASVPYIFEMY